MIDVRKMTVAVVVIGALAGAAQDSEAGRIRIVSIGDSLASGEGNPDQISPFVTWDGSRDAVDRRWGDPATLAVIDGQDWTCHRSQQSGHKWASELLGESRRDHDDVQFTSVACSGAKIPDLISTSQFSGVIPQIERVRQLFPPGSPDAGIDVLLVSIGINDVGFAAAVTTCMNPLDDCTDNFELSPNPGSADPWPGNLSAAPALDGGPGFRATKLRARWDVLIRTIEERLPNVGMVLVHEYPDGMTDMFGGWCNGMVYQVTWIFGVPYYMPMPMPDPLAGVNAAESQWASANGIGVLNTTVRTGVRAAEATRWSYHDGIAGTFYRHGFCAGSNRWVNTVGDAVAVQANFGGTAHPNPFGHASYASQLHDRMQQVDWDRARATPAAPAVPSYGATTASGATPRLLTSTSAFVPWDHAGTPAMFFQVAWRMAGLGDNTPPAAQGDVPWLVPGAPSVGTRWFDTATGWRTATRAGDGTIRSQTIALTGFGSWRFSVRACSFERCSAWSAPITLENYTPPPPSDLHLTGGSGRTVTVGWTATGSPYNRTHQIAWRAAAGGAWAYASRAMPFASLKLTFPTDGRFDMFVRACGQIYCSSWAPGIRLATSLPVAPSGLGRWPATGANSIFGVQLSWSNPASALTGHVVQVALKDGSSYGPPYRYQLLPYDENELFVSWEVMSWVRACNERGCTPWSPRVGGPAEPEPPTTPVPPAQGPGSPPPA